MSLLKLSGINTYYGKINLEVESETVLGSADACVDRLGSLFARGIETVILRLVKLDLAQLDVLKDTSASLSR